MFCSAVSMGTSSPTWLDWDGPGILTFYCSMLLYIAMSRKGALEEYLGLIDLLIGSATGPRYVHTPLQTQQS